MRQAFFRDKVVDFGVLNMLLASWKSCKTNFVVFTTGAFDMLHPGHVSYLWKAAEYGSHLLVGIDSDARVKAAKGKHRPIISEEDRAAVVAGLACVDMVFIFDDMKQALDVVKPNAIVVSPTSTEDAVFDRIAYARENGAKIITVPEQSQKHTSDYVMAILKNFAVLDRSPDK